jgi:hypothetical protein
MTRDNALVWWLGIGGALLVFLIADQRNPMTWAYMDWLKFLMAVISTVAGKLSSSPLKHSNEKEFDQ